MATRFNQGGAQASPVLFVQDAGDFNPTGGIMIITVMSGNQPIQIAMPMGVYSAHIGTGMRALKLWQTEQHSAPVIDLEKARKALKKPIRVKGKSL